MSAAPADTASPHAVTLTSPGGSSATVAVARGFNLFRFAAALPDGGPLDVLACEAEFPAGGKPSHSGIPLLFPFPNRVKGGEYVVDQQESHVLPLGDGPGEVHSDGAGNAIHGFAFDRPWRLIDSADDEATGEFQLSKDAADRLPLWPSDVRLTVRYALRDDPAPTLRCDLTAENVDGAPCPFGLGTHPYFALPPGGAGTAADCTVTVPAAARWKLIGGVPTGEIVELDERDDLRSGARFGPLQLDDVYTRVSETEPGSGVIESVVENPETGVRVVQRCDAAFREQVVFTPPWFRSGDAGAICIEPYTCATDAVNLQGRGVDAGLRTLAPSERFQTWFEIAVEKP